jgi:two-component system chemotaxis response regulator CheB
MERDIIVIGTSAGGFEALPELLRQLPENFPAAILVVHHLESGSHGAELLEVMKKSSSLPCLFPHNNDPIEYGKVYLAPSDHQMLLKDGRILVIRGPRDNRYRPSIDTLFRSAAAQYSNSVIGIILTGLLNDGSCGLESIKKSGGIAIVQHPDEADFPDMPLSAIRDVPVDHIVRLNEMGKLLESLVHSPLMEKTIPPKFVKVEAEISERFTNSGIEKIKEIGDEIPYSCPDCGGALFQVRDSDLVRYRCHVGHIYNQSGFLKAHARKIEEALWTSLRMWEERLHMLTNLLVAQKKNGNVLYSNTLEERMEEVAQHINKIREILSGDELYAD